MRNRWSRAADVGASARKKNGNTYERQQFVSNQLDLFIDFMRSCGIGPVDTKEIIADDKRHRYRVEGDKVKTRNGSYQLRIEPDGFAVGWAMTFKDGVVHTWHSKSSRRATAEEREAWKKKAAEAKAKREAEAKQQAKAAADKAARIWEAAKPGKTAYHGRKQIEPHRARVWRDMCVVPMRKGPDIVGLQFIKDDGEKRFLTGSAKEGSYYSIAAKSDDTSRIIICEGYATGCTLRDALGWPIIVAWDAGNLKPVAVQIRTNYPNSDIIIAADNDQWTTNAKGEPVNTGVEKAQQAAVKIGGARVIYPQVFADDPARRTDWNDIAVTDGLDAVRDAILAPALVKAVTDPMEGYEPDFVVPDFEDNGLSDIDRWVNERIRPLGHNRGSYYFFPRASGQIVDLSSTALSRMQNLYRLAPREQWEAIYPQSNDSTITAMASDALMRECHKRGIFQPDTTRGVGAWVDQGRVVVNTGDKVICNHQSYDPSDFVGEAVYESGPRVISLNYHPLTNAEANGLRVVCSRLNWKRPMHSDILAGWLAIAPISGALPWRPHIWLTGRSGAGKSTVLEEIVKPVLGAIAIRRDGGTTEAGVRKALGTSGRPFILDEAESETQTDRNNMEKIVFLARRASSGGLVENANASFQARSCFCFSAINPRVEQNADKGRITQIELMQDIRPDRDKRFDDLLSLIGSTITPDFSGRLLVRTLQNMQALLANIRTFSLAASFVLGNKRAGDQFGPMIAGAYSLTSTKEISFDDAKNWMQNQEWDWSHSGDEDTDAAKLVSHILTSRVSYDKDGYRRESSIGEMICLANDHYADDHRQAVNGLSGYGVKVVDGMIYIANSSPQMRKLLRDTPWVPWVRTLSDYPGSDNNGNKTVYFAAGLSSKCIRVPVASVISGPDDALPLSSGDEELDF